jgi:pseudouridine-5'-monophosphatase
MQPSLGSITLDFRTLACNQQQNIHRGSQTKDLPRKALALEQTFLPIMRTPEQASFRPDVEHSDTLSFPPIRAAIFDMDGLLLSTEDLYFECVSNILEKYKKPHLPSSLKPKPMGVPSPVAPSTFYAWANLPITRAEFDREQMEQQMIHYPKGGLMPGVKEFVQDLKMAGVEIALASSSSTEMLELKPSRKEIKRLFDIFPPFQIILGDNLAIKEGRGKPAPDIFLLALDVINSSRSHDHQIKLNECLVFEDSVPGVEAGVRV